MAASRDDFPLPTGPTIAIKSVVSASNVMSWITLVASSETAASPVQISLLILKPHVAVRFSHFTALNKTSMFSVGRVSQL